MRVSLLLTSFSPLYFRDACKQGCVTQDYRCSAGWLIGFDSAYDRRKEKCVFKELTFDDEARKICEGNKKDGKFYYDDVNNICEPACKLKVFNTCMNPLETPQIPYPTEILSSAANKSASVVSHVSGGISGTVGKVGTAVGGFANTIKNKVMSIVKK